MTSHSGWEGRTTTFSLFTHSQSAGGLLAEAMTPPLRVSTAARPPRKVVPEDGSVRADSAARPSNRSSTFFPELLMNVSCSNMSMFASVTATALLTVKQMRSWASGNASSTRRLRSAGDGGDGGGGEGGEGGGAASKCPCGGGGGRRHEQPMQGGCTASRGTGNHSELLSL